MGCREVRGALRCEDPERKESYSDLQACPAVSGGVREAGEVALRMD